MRVLILGPIVNKKTSGGVAVFDEGLCAGFRELGDEANVLSIEKSTNIDNLLIKIRNSKAYKIFFNFRKIAKAIKKYEPDLVISSLQYSAGIRRYKKSWGKAKYIQILHGTPCPINGRFKSWCVNFVARYSKKHFDKLVTVSHLSWSINKKINRVECDAIINTGCTLKKLPINSDRIYDFCYVGRLYRDKNIEKMMDALIKLHEQNDNIKVCIAGFGEQEGLFLEGGKYNLNFVDFKGKVDHSKVSDIYQNSKFFISLCELEACGLAFSEAAINGCNPIASLSSGQSSLFRGKKYYHEVNAYNVSVLVAELKKVISNYTPILESDVDELRNIFDYKNIALQYKALLDE